MKEITAVKINPTDFAPFGTYCSMTEPKGYPLQGRNPQILSGSYLRYLYGKYGIFSHCRTQG